MSQQEQAQKFVENGVGAKVKHFSSWTSWHAFQLGSEKGSIIVVNWNVFEQKFKFQNPSKKVQIALGIHR